VARTTSEDRQELLDVIAHAANELGFAVACLADAYEQLDEQSADRLERDCFRPVQVAYGRAQRAHAGFAARHGFQPVAFEQQAAGLPSQGAAGFVTRAAEAAAAADRELAELQDSMLPVEAGDEELRAGLRSIREPLAGLPGKARDFLRTLGR
jgi:hypothetical protein